MNKWMNVWIETFEKLSFCTTIYLRVLFTGPKVALWSSWDFCTQYFTHYFRILTAVPPMPIYQSNSLFNCLKTKFSTLHQWWNGGTTEQVCILTRLPNSRICPQRALLSIRWQDYLTVINLRPCLRVASSREAKGVLLFKTWCCRMPAASSIMYHPIKIWGSLAPCQAHSTSLHGLVVVRLDTGTIILRILYIRWCDSAFPFTLYQQLSGQDCYNNTVYHFPPACFVKVIVDSIWMYGAWLDDLLNALTK